MIDNCSVGCGDDGEHGGESDNAHQAVEPGGGRTFSRSGIKARIKHPRPTGMQSTVKYTWTPCARSRTVRTQKRGLNYAEKCNHRQRRIMMYVIKI